jgi:secreted trypsin-like serine protease
LKTRLLLALALLVAVLAPLAGPADAAPQPEIIGGHQADPGEYPFQVAILKRNVANRFQAQFCGGSLISSTLVLTAAHCVVDRQANRLDVLAGTHTLAQNGSGTRVHVSAKHVHPGYNPRTSGNDIAVLQLATSVPYDTIPIVQAGQGALWDPGTVATVTGWGDRDRRDCCTNFPANLYEVDVPILSNPQCTNAYGSGYIRTKMLCAGDLNNGGEDSCQGDSGGPLFVPDGGSGVMQVGVVSFGVGCARRQFPGVYTRVNAYRAFINQYLP